MARTKGESTLHPLHEAVMVCIPDSESFLRKNKPQGIESYRFCERQLFLLGFPPFFESKFLPLVNPVGTIRAHIVAATYPRLAVIPFPRFLLRPWASPSGPGWNCEQRAQQNDNQYSPHSPVLQYLLLQMYYFHVNFRSGAIEIWAAHTTKAADPEKISCLRSVGVPRLERGTPCSQSRCASQLRHTPKRTANIHGFRQSAKNSIFV